MCGSQCPMEQSKQDKKDALLHGFTKEQNDTTSLAEGSTLSAEKVCEEPIFSFLSKDWLHENSTILLDNQLKALGPRVFDGQSVEDMILTLESHERRIDSVIRSKVVVRKNLLYSCAPTLSTLCDSLRKGVASCQTFRGHLATLRTTIVDGSLMVFGLFFLQRRYIALQDFVRVIKEILNHHECAQQLMQRKDYLQATCTLLQNQKIISKYQGALNSSETRVGGALVTKSHKMWHSLHQKLTFQLTTLLSQCVEGVRRKSTLRKLNRCLSCLSVFEDQTRVGDIVVASFTDILSGIIRMRLMTFLDQDTKQLYYYDMDTISLKQLCSLVPVPQIAMVVAGILELFLNVWIAYAEIILWATKHAEAELKKRDECSPQRVSKTQTQDSFVDALLNDSPIVAQCIGLEISSKKEDLLEKNQMQLFEFLDALDLQRSDIRFEDYFKIYVMLNRFALEIHAITEKSVSDWGTAITFHDMNMRKSLNGCPFTKLTIYLHTLTDNYFTSHFTKAISRMSAVLKEDSWERLPLREDDYGSLVSRRPVTSHSYNFLTLVLYDRETYPAYCVRRNPFVRWNPSPNWLRRFRFAVHDAAQPETTSLRAYQVNVAKEAPRDEPPVISSSAQQLFMIWNDFRRFLALFPYIKIKVEMGVLVLLDLFCVVCCYYFSSKTYMKRLVSSGSIRDPTSEFAGLEERHRAVLFQRAYPDLARLLRCFTNLLVPDGCFTLATTKFLENLQQEEDAPYREALYGELHIISSEFRGFLLETLPQTGNQTTLWQLAERVTAAESSYSLYCVMNDFIFHERVSASAQRSSSSSSLVESPLRRLIKVRQKVVDQLRECLYMQAAECLFNLKPLVKVIRNWKWESENEHLGLFPEKLRIQLEDLQRQIECCGGGSIPVNAQNQLWRCIGTHSVKSCAQGIAENPSPFPNVSLMSSTPRAFSLSGLDVLIKDHYDMVNHQANPDSTNVSLSSLCRLCKQIREFLLVVSSEIERIHESSKTLPESQNESSTYIMDTDYLNCYIQGHSLRGSAAFTWCKLQNNYDLWMTTQLLHKTNFQCQLQEYHIAELRSHIEALLNAFE